MKNILLILSVAMLGTGCKKLIDGPDHSTISTSVVVKTSRDLDNLLYGAYGAIGNANTVTGNWKIFPELLADHVVVNVDANDPADPYMQVYNRNLTMAQYPENWRLAYTAIQNANMVLYAIENKLVTKEIDPSFSDPIKDKMVGEAYFIRALCFFELVRFYGQQYQFTTLPSAGNPGVPSPENKKASSGIILRVKPIINVTSMDEISSQGRATVEETYQQVISDLKNAEALLPPVSLQGLVARRGRATNFAASAILARVYFQQNDFPNTMTQIVKVIGDSAGGIKGDFQLVRANTGTTTATVAQAQANVQAAFKSTNATAARVTENIYDLVSTAIYSVNQVVNRKYLRSATVEPHLAISNAFLTAANFNANDQRKVIMVTTVGAKNYTKKYDQTVMNVPVIRSAELVLDRAEINATLAATLPSGSVAHQAAIEDLRLLRSRAISNTAAAYPTTATITPANILAEVRTERIRELAFEGDRLHNLRRMQAMVGPGDRAGVAPLPWNSNKFLFKIPDAEIKASTNLIQNPD